MKIRDLDCVIVSELRITFDEDPHDGRIDVVVPVTINHLDEILGEPILDMEVHLMKATDDAIVVSTFTRG